MTPAACGRCSTPAPIRILATAWARRRCTTRPGTATARSSSCCSNHHADVNARHLEAGSTPLHYAVIKDHPEIVALLLARGADVQATYRSGATALHLAADRGYRDIAALLLAHGADVNARDLSGAAPLDEAAEKGYARRAALLVEKGAPGERQKSRHRRHAAQ